MKTRKYLIVQTITAALALAAIAAPSAHAQNHIDSAAMFSKFLQGDPATVAINNATQASDVAMLIRYSARSQSLTKPSGTVQVTATTILFKVGANGAEAADTTMQCGATPGTFDLTQATCDTVGEVVNLINASTGGFWKAVPHAALATDSVNNKVLASAAGRPSKQGYQVLWDTSKTAYFSGIFQPNPPDISWWINDPTNALKNYPENIQNYRVAVSNAIVALTSTGPSYTFYSILPSISSLGVYSETVTTLAGGPLTSATITTLNLGGPGIIGRKGERLMLRIAGSGATTVPYMYAYGTVFPR